MKIVKAVAFSAVVLAMVAMVAVAVYHHKEEIIPEVKDFAKQRMADVDDLWANTDLGEYMNYFADLLKWEKNEKYLVEVTTESSYNYMGIFKGKKMEKFNVKI